MDIYHVSDTALKMPAPTKNERQKCWDARDNFWNCLTENNDNESKCTEFKKVFEAQCTKQWVCNNFTSLMYCAALFMT